MWDALGYAIVPVAYLCLVAWWPTRIPAKVYGGAAILLLAYNTVVNGVGWGLLSFALSLLLFLVLLILQLGGRDTVLAVATTLLGLPPTQWWLLAVGLVTAVLVAAYRIKTTAGSDYILLLTFETMGALGVSSNGLGKPDLSRLPTPSQNPDDSTAVGRAETIHLPLLKFLAIGAAVGLVVVLVAVVIINR